MKKAKKSKSSNPAKAVPAFYKYARAKTSASRSASRGTPQHAEPVANTIPELRRYLKKNEPADGEYQDGLHRSRVRAAQYELMRLEYINGNIKAADKLLAVLQDLT